MRKKLVVLFILGCGLFLVFPPLPNKLSLISVFRVTEEPVAITRGTYGSALTINLSFGDIEVVEWIHTLEKPYPLLFVDLEWANRSPDTIQLINEKNIPVGLLGHTGTAYEENEKLLLKQVEQFEDIFDEKPLWFRTVDETFPNALQTSLWELKINALGSSVIWTGGTVPKAVKGEIISIPHHQKERVPLSSLIQLTESRDFQTIEDVLFGPIGKTKKIPK